MIGIGDLNAIPVGRTVRRVARLVPHRRGGVAGHRYRSWVGSRSRGRRSPPCEVATFGVEYLVRTARITDIDRIVVLSDGVVAGDRDDGTLDAASLLRQLVYLPQASIFVAETQRVVVGGAVLALRPSVRARGFVGTIDLMVVDPDHDADRVTDALLEELIRSASNKGCTLVEASRPDDPDAAERWTRQGFSPAGPRIQRLVTVAGRATRRA
jgi:GNAT superfamily N-acetyltransferase